MNFLTRMIAKRQRNESTEFARARLAKTMPGETGAVVANRLGFLIG